MFQEVIGEGKQGQETNRKGCYTKVWVASLARDDLAYRRVGIFLILVMILLWTPRRAPQGGGAGNERD